MISWFKEKLQRKIVGHWKIALEQIPKLFLYSLIISLIDVLLIFLFSWGIDTFAYTLSIFMLIEGGLGLIFGSFISAYSPSVAKLNEILFHSEPWNFAKQKEIEKRMRIVLITGFLLIIEALFVSAL
jgi:hypothetical protein